MCVRKECVRLGVGLRLGTVSFLEDEGEGRGGEEQGSASASGHDVNDVVTI